MKQVLVVQEAIMSENPETAVAEQEVIDIEATDMSTEEADKAVEAEAVVDESIETELAVSAEGDATEAVVDEAIAPEIVEAVPARFATHYGFVPVRVENGTIVVAVSDPLNAHLLDDIRLVLKKRIEAVVATPEDIDKTSKALYGLGADTMERILSDSESANASQEIKLVSGV